MGHVTRLLIVNQQSHDATTRPRHEEAGARRPPPPRLSWCFDSNMSSMARWRGKVACFAFLGDIEPWSSQSQGRFRARHGSKDAGIRRVVSLRPAGRAAFLSPSSRPRPECRASTSTFSLVRPPSPSLFLVVSRFLFLSPLVHVVCSILRRASSHPWRVRMANLAYSQKQGIIARAPIPTNPSFATKEELVSRL